MPGKSLTQSKTMVFAVATALVAALNATEGFITDPQALSWVAVGIAAVNAFLRVITKEPIK